MKRTLHIISAIFAVMVISMAFANKAKAQYRISYEIGIGGAAYLQNGDKTDPGYTIFNEVRFYTGKWVDLGIRLEDNFACRHRSAKDPNFNDNALSLLGVADFNFAFAEKVNPYIGVEFGGSMMHHQDLDFRYTLCYTDLAVGPRVGLELGHHFKLAANYRFSVFHERFSYLGFTVSWSFEI